MSASVPHRLKPTRLFCPWMGFSGKEHWSGLPLPSPGDRASLIAQLVRFWFDPWVRKIPWRRDRLPTPVLLGFPCGSAGEESAHNAEDLGSIPGLQRSPREGKGYPLQYSALENAMDYVVREFSTSQTRLSDFHFHFLRGALPSSGIKPRSPPLQADSLLSETPGKSNRETKTYKMRRGLGIFLEVQ